MGLTKEQAQRLDELAEDIAAAWRARAIAVDRKQEAVERMVASRRDLDAALQALSLIHI